MMQKTMPDQILKKWRGRIGGALGAALTATGFVFGPELSALIGTSHQHREVAQVIGYLEKRTVMTCGQ
jgi:hypothetical protein